MPDHIEPDVARGIAAASALTGISIAAVSGTYNMIHPNKQVRRDGMARLAVLAEACATMGTRLITLCTGTRDSEDQWRGHPDNSSLEAWSDLRTEMEAAIEIAERFDIFLGIEPELVPGQWWEHLLHNQTALRLKAALLFHPGVIVANVPYHLAR